MANKDELNSALEKIKKDDKLLKQFYENPKSVLEGMDVNTSNLSIKKVENQAKNEEYDCLSLSACVSIGEIVGVSVGGGI